MISIDEILVCRKSLLKYDVFTVAMGCTLLSSKVEEQLKTLREVIPSIV